VPGSAVTVPWCAVTTERTIAVGAFRADAHQPNRQTAPGTVWMTGGSSSLRRNVITTIRTALVNGFACSSHGFSSRCSGVTAVSAGTRPRPPAERVHPGHQLGEGERLGQVVVGADAQRIRTA
jgi:hypothetical protein